MLYNNNRGEYMKYTEERKPIINILFFALSMVCLFVMPSVFYTIMCMFFEDSLTLQFLSELFAIVLLFLIYYKDLIKEFKMFTGYTPTQLLDICDIYTENLSEFNSVFINDNKELNNIAL